MGNQTAIAKGRVEVEAARGQARDGGDTSLGNPMEEMMVATHTALNATKNAGPLVAERMKDGERLLSDVMAFEQTAAAFHRRSNGGTWTATRHGVRPTGNCARRLRAYVIGGTS